MKSALRNLIGALLLGSLSFFGACTPPRAYYLTRPANTFRDSTADSAIVHMDDRTMVWLTSIYYLALKHEHEEAGCARIARQEGNEFWIDSLMSSRTPIERPNDMSIRFACLPEEAVWHVHWRKNGLECYVSMIDTDASNAIHPVDMMLCGPGVEHLTAYTVKKRPVKVPPKVDIGQGIK